MTPQPSRWLPLTRRRQIFAALVLLQDQHVVTLDASRLRIMAEHDIGLEQLKEIEREGINGDWPPLPAPDVDDGDDNGE
jgi:hypothetical protein